jgi:arginyl-tRNA--protein-N-Asp/Glu arginylyltransferase
MKLLFSEAKPDYGHYIFPYAIWAFPEPGETPADLFAAGFLPSSRQLDRFYLCRHIRVGLEKFDLSSENRRILRKGEGIAVQLIPRTEFEFTAARREFCKRYTDARFGAEGMSYERLHSLFNSPVTTHVLRFTEMATNAEVGLATLYIEGDRAVFYYYAFYDLTHTNRSLGMFMMTSAVEWFAVRGCRQIYLGSCYAENALYKTQFAGFEFFNGFRWSDSVAELKYLLKRSQGELSQHLLECEEYREEFAPGELAKLAAQSVFRAKPLTPERPQ